MSTPTPKSSAEKRALSAHHKLILLGTWLLLSCAAIASLGIWGVVSIQSDSVDLARRDLPAITLLLRIDTDLYQAQLGLERAVRAGEPLPKSAALGFFSENVTESERRLDEFKKLASPNDQDAPILASYEAERARWLALADKLNPSSVPQSKESAESDLKLAHESLESMRELLNRIVESRRLVLETSLRRAERSAGTTCWKLVAGVAIALIAGIALTRNMARTLLAQQVNTESLNAERAEKTRRQAFETRLTRGLEMALDEESALRLVESAITVAAPAVAAEILLADSSRAHLHLAASVGSARPGPACGVAKPSDCPAVRRGHRLAFDSSTHFDSCPHLKGRPGGDCSAVCVPLSIMGQTVGVLHATTPDGQLPPEDQVWALEQVASKSGERIGILRAFRRTEAQASCDPLTGLLNRRSLEEKVFELNRQNTPFAIAYGDLDHFKNLNDTHGHETGDKALRTFAHVLRSTIRQGDLAARWGGEEFVLVMPRTSVQEAKAVLERVRESLGVVLQGADTPAFTVSFGLASTTDGAIFTDVLASADESLLRAKREGRNRTVISDGVVIPRQMSIPPSADSDN